MSVLLSIGIAAAVPALAFNFHWFADTGKNRWSGWAATGCATVSVFCIVLGNLIR